MLLHSPLGSICKPHTNIFNTSGTRNVRRSLRFKVEAAAQKRDDQAAEQDPRLKYARREWLVPQQQQQQQQQNAAGSSPSASSSSSPQQQQQQQQPKPAPPIVLGVDLGTVWTGIAAGERGRATPLRVARADGAGGRAALARELAAEAVRRGAQAIVVGIPLRPGQALADYAKDTRQAAVCRSFAESLSIVAGAVGVDVILYDETRTTAAAMLQAGVPGSDRNNLGRAHKNAHAVDAWSAALLVTRFYAAPGAGARLRLARGPHGGDGSGGSGDGADGGGTSSSSSGSSSGGAAAAPARPSAGGRPQRGGGGAPPKEPPPVSTTTTSVSNAPARLQPRPVRPKPPPDGG